jgi:ATP synthase protein I
MASGNDPNTSRKMGIAYAAGLTLFVSVISLSGLGWLLDRWLKTAPWLLVAGLVLGAIVGFYQFVKLTSKLT